MQTVLLLFGGESSEHEVSLASAANVSGAIDTDRFKVLYVFIDVSGQWWLVDSITSKQSKTARRLLPLLGKKSFSVEASDDTIMPDVILPILHGRNGEDGSVQALAQLLHIPIVGCGMAASAAAMSKYITKEIAMANQINIVPFGVHYASDPLPDFEIVSKNLGTTLFIKPNSAGSSVGVHKVTTQDELHAALHDAHQHDEIVLMEKAIDARELEVAVLGNYPNIMMSVVGEIKPEGQFYSYESKYDKTSASEVTIPAEIASEISDQLRQQAGQIYHLLGGSGMARVDFFIDKETQQIYLNEVNTIPGFTNISMYPKLWEQAGINYTDLISRLIDLAVSS